MQSMASSGVPTGWLPGRQPALTGVIRRVGPGRICPATTRLSLCSAQSATKSATGRAGLDEVVRTGVRRPRRTGRDPRASGRQHGCSGSDRCGGRRVVDRRRVHRCVANPPTGRAREPGSHVRRPSHVLLGGRRGSRMAVVRMAGLLGDRSGVGQRDEHRGSRLRTVATPPVAPAGPRDAVVHPRFPPHHTRPHTSWLD